MKLIALYLLLISSVYSDAKFYIGSTYGVYNETFTQDIDAKNSSELATIKFAYGDIKAYAVEMSIEYAKNKSKIFSSPTSTQNDGTRSGFNVDFVKAFDLSTFFLPYLKVGFGTGNMKIERVMQDNLSYGSFNIAIGTFIPLNSSFDLEVGYQYKYITYEAIDTIAEKLRYEADANILFAGFNFRF